jgi:hypothetical protein
MDIDKSFPLVEGAVETELAGKREGSKTCLNCETELTDVYCPHCGQKDIPPRQTFGELMINFISSFWSFESKFLQTGKLILFQPGQLAKDYNAGKRERYFHPARMYVFISFVYFLFIGILPDSDSTDTNDQNSEDNSEVNWKYDDKVGGYKTFAQYDSAQQVLPLEERDGKIKRMIYKRVSELNERYKQSGRSFGEDFGANFMANTPRIFFVLLPIFALLLKLLYVRRDYFYSEHLVFSIYYYNFFFLAGSLYMLANQVPYLNHVSWLFILWIGLYLLFALRKMYLQSWRKTILKYCTFVFIFSFCILLGLTTNAFITFLII